MGNGGSEIHCMLLYMCREMLSIIFDQLKIKCSYNTVLFRLRVWTVSDLLFSMCPRGKL